MSFLGLENLSDREIPPLPLTFRGDLNRRINRSLTISMVVEFMFQAVPYAMGHFLAVTLGSLLAPLPRDKKSVSEESSTQEDSPPGD